MYTMSSEPFLEATDERLVEGDLGARVRGSWSFCSPRSAVESTSCKLKMSVYRRVVSMAVATLWFALLASRQTLAALSVLAGYSALPLSLALEESFLKIAANASSYGATVTKRVCVLRVESAWVATYKIVQLNYFVTGCDISLGLLAQNKVPTKTAVTGELGRCSATMTEACYASRLRASFEILEKSPAMIWYLATEDLAG